VFKLGLTADYLEDDRIDVEVEVDQNFGHFCHILGKCWQFLLSLSISNIFNAT
jgi:hypothetical protein